MSSRYLKKLLVLLSVTGCCWLGCPALAAAPAAEVAPASPAAGAAAMPDKGLPGGHDHPLLSRPLSGKVQWLEAGGKSFLALYTLQSSAEPKGCVILLHDRGGHPEWPDVIAPLRNYLPEHGWSTLSMELPVPDSAAGAADYMAQLDLMPAHLRAATDFLIAQEQTGPVVLIGHGLGAALAAPTLATREDSGIDAFIGIGMGHRADQASLAITPHLEALDIPVLDLLGSRDLPEVLNDSEVRRKAMSRGKHASYRQLVIDGADHDFSGLSQELQRRVRGWLRVRAGEFENSDDAAPETETP